MQKATFVKAALCLAGAMVLSATTLTLKATSLNFTETAVAGIVVPIEEYYIATLDKTANEEGQNIKKLTTDTATEKTIQASTDKSIDGTNNVKEETKEVKEESIDKTKKIEENKVSPYEKVGISKANDYVNIRSLPSEEGVVLGKLYRGSAADILDYDGEWVKIKSGKVEGYIKTEYLAIGDEVDGMTEKYGTKLATVNTVTLKVREEKSTEATILDLIPLGETYEVIKEYDEWIEIIVDESLTGFVSKDYVDITVEFTKAISVEEEKARIEAEEEAERAIMEAIQKEEERQARVAKEQADKKASQEKKAEEIKKVEEVKNTDTINKNSETSKSETSKIEETSKAEEPQETTVSNETSQTTENKSSDSSSEASGTRAEIVTFAKKFLGNKYVYGGSSLTNGTDCSGFTMSVYSHFGYNIGRSSRDQAQSSQGTTISLSSVKPGDLVFYSRNGTINHVAMYIGDGKVIHASSPRTGITISNMYYRQPCKAKRFIND